LPVDSLMTEFSIAFQGAGLDITLSKPDGTALDLTGAGVKVTASSDGKFINVANATVVPGSWTVTIQGTGSFYCDARGVSPLHFTSFDFVELRGRPGHTGYYPINDTLVAYDHAVAAVAYLDGAFSTATFDLRGPGNNHLVDANMKQGSGDEGAAPSNNFFGEMQLVAGTLYAYVKGVDSSGVPYQRVRQGVFTPIVSGTTKTGFDNIDIQALLVAAAAASNHTITFSANATASASASSSSAFSSTTTTAGYSSLPPYIPETYCPHETGAKTHTEYMTEGCDDFTTTVYTTVSLCPDGSHSTLTITETLVVPCPTCTGKNYPHHTGEGPWPTETYTLGHNTWEPAPTGSSGGQGGWGGSGSGSDPGKGSGKTTSSTYATAKATGYGGEIYHGDSSSMNSLGAVVLAVAGTFAALAVLL
jgi:hypothetical protein